MRYGLLACTTALAIGLGPSTARAQETTTYQYDSLGRLTTVSVSGVTNNGVATSYSLDPAGNRLGVTVTGASGSTPTSSLSANAENVTHATGFICNGIVIDVLANKADSAGYYPLQLVSFASNTNFRIHNKQFGHLTDYAGRVLVPSIASWITV